MDEPTTTASRELTLYYPGNKTAEDKARDVTVVNASTTIEPLLTTEAIKPTTQAISSSRASTTNQQINNQSPERIDFQIYGILYTVYTRVPSYSSNL